MKFSELKKMTKKDILAFIEFVNEYVGFLEGEE